MKTITTLFGMMFGALLVGGHLTDYNVIHEGLLLRSPFVFLLMGSTTLVGMGGLWLLEKRRWVTPYGGPLRLHRSGIQRKHILGGVLFGIGWAVTGTCPAVSAAQLGSGTLAGIVVMGGLLVGTVLKDLVARSSHSHSTVGISKPSS